CFGVPPLVLGLPGDNTRANYVEANAAFWRQAVIPMVQRLQRAFEHWLQPAWPGLRFDYDVDRIDALSTERAAEWARVDAATFLSVDEKRELLGFAAKNIGAEPQSGP
ncbi:MAG TPA: phage portal protein, partial [Rhodoblastus sp.]|nr:phage portal protein [Rhodoblastus sp.]